MHDTFFVVNCHLNGVNHLILVKNIYVMIVFIIQMHSEVHIVAEECFNAMFSIDSLLLGVRAVSDRSGPVKNLVMKDILREIQT